VATPVLVGPGRRTGPGLEVATSPAVARCRPAVGACHTQLALVAASGARYDIRFAPQLLRCANEHMSLATDGVMRFLSLRAVFLFGFVIAMPVLALPPVARQIDRLLYGAPPTDFGRPPAAPPLPHEPAAEPPASIAQASYNEPSPAPATAFAAQESPPLLAAAPQFALAGARAAD
jgi:hypothetical protein